MNENSTKDPARADEGSLFDNWIDAIEDGVRSRMRGFIETMLEEELSQVLARPRYGRHDINVGILSTGDVSATLFRELAELQGFGCDVIVCACNASDRKTTATEDMVIQFAREHGCSVAWIIKAYEEVLEAREAANAAEIAAAVQAACGL